MLRSILIVEDNPRDIELSAIALESYTLADKLDFVPDGNDAIRYLNDINISKGKRKVVPKVVILDLLLPGASGIEIMRTIRRNPAFGALPFVVFSASKNPIDISDAYEAGANAYVIKPQDPSEYAQALQCIADMFGALNQVPSPRVGTSLN